MKQKNIWTAILTYGLLISILIGICYYFIGAKSLKMISFTEEYSNADTTQITPNLASDTSVIQKFVTHADFIDGLTLRFATYNNTLKEGNIEVSLQNETRDVLYKKKIPVTDLKDNEDMQIDFENSVSVSRDDTLLIEVKELDNTDGNVATLWMGEKQDDCELYVNNKQVDGTLYFAPLSTRNGNYTRNFLIVFCAFEALFICICLHQKKKDEQGIRTGLNECVYIFKNYRFLLTQLIGRDFAVKYRRSYLGIVWVILNPLLTMIVLSAVFAFIFRFNIANFPVYLILGQVIFNFYSEATQISTTTITGSGQMIKKIYIPKYIFTLSKTMFSFFNFVLSFIPVLLVIIYYRIPITLNILYLPLLLVAYFCFVLGISFILSAMQVFMRDTQYLYGIFLTLLGYTTPIFYSVDAMSPLLQRVMLINPLYHYMTVLRTILLYGTAPTLQEMSVCILLGGIFLGIGLSYFFKRQKKFILYI